MDARRTNGQDKRCKEMSSTYKRSGCCQNQNIHVRTNIQASERKTPLTEKHVKPFILTLSIVKSWFCLDQLPVFKLKPFLIEHVKEPLTILLQQFRI